LEDELDLLIKAGAEEQEHAFDELVLREVGVCILINDGVEAFSDETRQLTVVDEADFVYAFGF
jgi:hypothetical protein